MGQGFWEGEEEESIGLGALACLDGDLVVYYGFWGLFEMIFVAWGL